MTLCITILEDNEVHRRQLERVLERAAKGLKLGIRCLAFASGLDIEDETIIKTDMFFLDVETPHRDGMDTARYIREKSQSVPIVFVTSHGKYAMKGYGVHAFHFLMKPAREADCVECLKMAARYARGRAEKQLVITQARKKHLVPYASILYAVSEDHNCRIISDEGDFIYRKNLSELLLELQDDSFVQCHRSYLINIGRVRVREAREIVLDNGTRVPATASYRNAINRALAEKLRGGPME